MSKLPEGYKPIKFEMLEAYKTIQNKTPGKAADYTFTNLWGWAEYYGLALSVRSDLCWIYQSRPEPCYWAPVGDWVNADWESHPEIQSGVTLHRAHEELVEFLSARWPDKITVEDSRDQWEYLYSREELAELKGNKFHKKKNHVNGFIKAYGEDYREVSLEKGSSQLDDLLLLQDEWCKWKDCDQSESLRAENEVIFRVVGNWGRLPDLIGGSLYVENKIVAFSIGEPMNEDTVVIHFEKVQPDYRGVYQAINNAFARHVGEQYKYINREQDMGEAGLRQAKETYNPIGFLKKSRLVIKGG